MASSNGFSRRIWIWVAVGALGLPCAQADYKADIGYYDFTNSLAELSVDRPTGEGISVSHVEGYYGALYKYTPNTNDADFAGKTFTFVSTPASNSDHATRVGKALYGLTNSIAPGINNIAAYYNTDWINTVLNYGTTKAPEIETRSIQNHSWIATNLSTTARQDIIRRLDFQIQRDQTIVVAGLNNGWNTTVPDLLGHSYNAIIVGLPNGNHSRTGTVFDGVGRLKPDLVASPHPWNATSYSTPVVGAAAGLLLELARSDSGLNRATNAVAIKSILMAGAVKTNLASWSQTTTQPIDEVFGAGALNINNSGLILLEGRQEASTNSTVAARGWDFATAVTNTVRFYYFDVATNTALAEFSASLNWNRIITDGQAGANWGNPQSAMANMALGLYQVASGFELGDLIYQSDSTVDNVEYIYQQGLANGRYALRVSGGDSTDYALSWTGIVVPEPSVALLCLLGGLLCVAARRRRRQRV